MLPHFCLARPRSGEIPFLSLHIAPALSRAPRATRTLLDIARGFPSSVSSFEVESTDGKPTERRSFTALHSLLHVRHPHSPPRPRDVPDLPRAAQLPASLCLSRSQRYSAGSLYPISAASENSHAPLRSAQLAAAFKHRTASSESRHALNPTLSSLPPSSSRRRPFPLSVVSPRVLSLTLTHFSFLLSSRVAHSRRNLNQSASKEE